MRARHDTPCSLLAALLCLPLTTLPTQVLCFSWMQERGQEVKYCVRFVEELTNIICPLLLFCYSRGGSLLFLVKKKKNYKGILSWPQSSISRRLSFPLCHPVAKILSMGCLYDTCITGNMCTTLTLQEICSNGWDWDSGSLNFNSISASAFLCPCKRKPHGSFTSTKFISLSRKKPHSCRYTVQCGGVAPFTTKTDL